MPSSSSISPTSGSTSSSLSGASPHSSISMGERVLTRVTGLAFSSLGPCRLSQHRSSHLRFAIRQKSTGSLFLRFQSSPDETLNAVGKRLARLFDIEVWHLPQG